MVRFLGETIDLSENTADYPLTVTVPVTWDGKDAANQAVASGVYYARLFTAQETSIKPMTLVR